MARRVQDMLSLLVMMGDDQNAIVEAIYPSGHTDFYHTKCAGISAKLPDNLREASVYFPATAYLGTIRCAYCKELSAMRVSLPDGAMRIREEDPHYVRAH